MVFRVSSAARFPLVNSNGITVDGQHYFSFEMTITVAAPAKKPEMNIKTADMKMVVIVWI